MRVPPVAPYREPVLASRAGRIAAIDNRRLAKVAKLAGAPDDKAAGVELHVGLGAAVTAGEPLYTVHSNAPGELAYSLDYVAANRDIMTVAED
jgi:thymidine phosphorylase